MTNTELLQALYDDMQTVKGHVFSLDERVSSLDEKVSSLDEKVSSLDEKVSSLDERVSSLETEIAKIPSLEKKISKISLILENETNRNIKIIAEAHLDLSRKLNESIKLSNDVKAEQEIHSIYINAFNRQLQVF